ncbi:MAG: hypothetical protein K8F91_14090 [Candidatus Obscuribacterales bacterium]|nr:hypothetical protein [Candidatus Obscuribacterales bacterium]
MEVLILAIAISLLIAIFPVRSKPRESLESQPAIERTIGLRYGAPEFNAQKINKETARLERLLNSDTATANPFVTRVHTETIVFEGKTFVVAEHDGILIIREDS